LLERFLAVGGFAHNLDILEGLQLLSQQFARNRLIIYDQGRNVATVHSR